MGLTDKLRTIMREIYEECYPDDIITKEKLILLIEETFDVTGATAKKYIKDIERRELLDKQSSMTWRVRDRKEIPDKYLQEEDDSDVRD